MELKEIFTNTNNNSMCIIIIDDIDLIFCDRSNSNVTNEQKRLISSLLSLIDGINSNQNIFLLTTSSIPNNIDRALRRPGRLDKEIELLVPTAIERELILQLLLKQSNIIVDNSIIQSIALQAHGMVGTDLLQIIKEATLISLAKTIEFKQLIKQTEIQTQTEDISMNQLNLQIQNMSINTNQQQQIQSEETPNTIIQITSEDLIKAASKVTPSALREITIESPNIHWKDIGGMESVKQLLKEVIEWPLLYPKLFQSMNVSISKGILLYGPPGCSKTLLAKALATESSMNFLAVRGPELLSKYLGESEKAIQTLFRRAKASSPSIIFFDEIDALTGKRGDSNAGVSDRVLSQLLTEIDGIQVIDLFNFFGSFYEFVRVYVCVITKLKLI